MQVALAEHVGRSLDHHVDGPSPGVGVVGRVEHRMDLGARDLGDRGPDLVQRADEGRFDDARVGGGDGTLHDRALGRVHDHGAHRRRGAGLLDHVLQRREPAARRGAAHDRRRRSTATISSLARRLTSAPVTMLDPWKVPGKLCSSQDTPAARRPRA